MKSLCTNCIFFSISGKFFTAQQYLFYNLKKNEKNFGFTSVSASKDDWFGMNCAYVAALKNIKLSKIKIFERNSSKDQYTTSLPYTNDIR